jgi:uncharacterized protein YerC
MPHISSQKVHVKTKEEIAKLFMALIANASAATRKRVLEELFTDTEKIMLAKRLAVIYMINKNVPTHSISDTLRVSPSTVLRFELAIARGNFRKCIQWIRIIRIGKPIQQLLERIASIPFQAQKKSLAQLSKDW